MGANDSHQLGTKAAEAELSLLRVEPLESHTVQHIAVGEGHMLAIVDNGQLASWGANGQGQTGQPLEGRLHHLSKAAGQSYAPPCTNLSHSISSLTVSYSYSSLCSRDMGIVHLHAFLNFLCHADSGTTLSLVKFCKLHSLQKAWEPSQQFC